MKNAAETISTYFQKAFSIFSYQTQDWNLVQNIKFTYLCIISALIVYPLLFIVLPPILIYRQFVKFAAQLTDSKCRNILTGWDAILASQDPYQNPLASICPYFVFTEKIDKSHIINTFNEKVIKPNLYPNLRQRIVRKLGYYFWYDVENFDLENHIRYLHPNFPDTPVIITEIRSLCVKLAENDYEPGRSPWEIILVPNLFDDENPEVRSCLLVRTHHCLMDGYAVANLLRTVSVSSWEFSGSPTENSVSDKGCHLQNCVNFLFQILGIILAGPYHTLKFFVFSDDNTPFLKDALNIKPNHFLGILEREAPRADGIKLKQIRDVHHVGMSSLLITLAIESITRLIKSRCKYVVGQLPKEIILHMSFPLPNHPKDLTNHWTCVRFPIRIRQENNSLGTLKDIHSQYEQMRESVAPSVNHLLTKIIGSLPVFLFPKPEAQLRQTVMLINFPGPKEKSDLFGYEWTYCAVLSNPIKGTAFFAACQNYAGKFWIDVGGLNNLLQGQNDLDELQENVRMVIKELEEPEQTGKLKSKDKSK